MLTRVLGKSELMILLRIRPYTTLHKFDVLAGSYVCQFDDNGPIRETVPPDFLLGRMLLKDCTLLTTTSGIVGVINVNYTVLGRRYYDSKRIADDYQDLRPSLGPVIEEAIKT